MGSIVVKDGDSLIPDDALSTVFKKFSKGSGLALATDGTLEMQGSKTAYTSMEEALKDINDVQCPLKKDTIVYFFTNYPDKLMDEDVQPFIVLADKDEKGEIDPMMICFIDGAVSESFEPDASEHTREYMAVNTYLAPKLQKMYAACGEDLEGLWKELADPIVKRELISALFDDTGDLVLLDATGEVRSLGYKSQEKDFSWGWMSDTCGYGEAPDKTAVDASIAATARDVMSKLKPGGVLSAIKAGVTAATAAINKPDTATEPAMVWVKPPKHIRQGSNNQKSKWYDTRTNVRPENWRECPAILMSVERATKEGLETVKQKDDKLPDGVHKVPDKKDTDTHHIPTSSPIVVVPPTQIEPALAMLKHVDANSQTILNPAEMAQEESKRPTFCDKVGRTGLESTLKWHETDLLPLFKAAPELALLLWADTRRAYISSLSEKPTSVPSVPASKAPVSEVMPQQTPSGVQIKRRQRM